MKLLILQRALDQGGAERQLVTLADGLVRRGHQVVVVSFYDNGALDPQLRATGARLVGLGKRHRWDVVGFLPRLVRALHAERPDVCLSYLSFTNSLLVLLRPAHRGGVAWSVSASDIPVKHYAWIHRVDAWLETRLRRWPDIIISNSFAGKADAIARGFPEKKLIVIVNGIDTAVFAPDPVGAKRVRNEWGVADEELLIGRVGRLDVQKDYPTFLEAAARLVAARPNLRFAIMGRDVHGNEVKLRQLADRLGISDRVIWAGPRDDMPAIYSALDLQVSSSQFGEGTPNVVSEGMACGTPCVVTDVGDSARTAGPLSIVVPARDAAALAGGIDAMLERVLTKQVDPAALRQFVIDHFNLETLIVETEAALRSVARGAR
jgi:glycosyltransferase involved in cell wall biosynthesis